MTDLEVFVVGDGAPDVTREIAAEFMQRDDRVRFFDHPKGLRRGDVYRHTALAEASGEAVIYLSDDDLWLPEHVETMIDALQDHDLVSAVAFRIYPRRSLQGPPARRLASPRETPGRRPRHPALVCRTHAGRLSSAPFRLEDGTDRGEDGQVHVAAARGPPHVSRRYHVAAHCPLPAERLAEDDDPLRAA